MRILHPLLLPGRIHIGRVRQVRLSVLLANEPSRRRDGLVRHAHRVGTHVGDEASRAIFTDVHTFVEALRRAHGATAGKAQLLGGFLLQRAGGERRPRTLPPLLLLDAGHDERLPAHGLHHSGGSLFVTELRLVPLDLVQRCLELLAILLALGLDGPVFLRLERANLALALHDEPQRHRLDPARREPGLDGLPENGARLVAHQPVQHPARLLGINLGLVDITGRTKCFLDGVLGDLVEEDAPGGHGNVQLGGYVPRNCLALAVRIGGEQDLTRRLGGFLDIAQRLGLALDGDVLGLEAPALLVDLDAKLARREIAQVSHRGLHCVASAQVLADGPRLGGRLHNDQGIARAHGGAVATGRGAGLGALGGRGAFGGLRGRGTPSPCSRLGLPSRLPGFPASRLFLCHDTNLAPWGRQRYNHSG